MRLQKVIATAAALAMSTTKPCKAFIAPSAPRVARTKPLTVSLQEPATTVKEATENRHDIHEESLLGQSPIGLATECPPSKIGIVDREPVPDAKLRNELHDLLGLSTKLNYKADLNKKELFHEAIENDRGRTMEGGGYGDQKSFSTKLGDGGPLVFYTDPDATGRRVKDTFAAAYPEFEDKVWWKSDFNKYDPQQYKALLERVVEYLNEKEDSTLYVQDVYAGRDPSFAVPFRFVGEYATHALFARTMFPKNVEGIENPDEKRWTMLNVPSFRTDPDRDGSRSDAAIIVDFRRRIALVAGPADYCGKISFLKSLSCNC